MLLTWSTHVLMCTRGPPQDQQDNEIKWKDNITMSSHAFRHHLKHVQEKYDDAVEETIQNLQNEYTTLVNQLTSDGNGGCVEHFKEYTQKRMEVLKISDRPCFRHLCSEP